MSEFFKVKNCLLDFLDQIFKIIRLFNSIYAGFSTVVNYRLPEEQDSYD